MDLTDKEKCINCYTCEKGISPDKTGKDIQEAIQKYGNIPDEWMVSQGQIENCENCYTCEKCDTVQGNCKNCYTCERCDSVQDGARCENCFTCEKCDTDQSGCNEWSRKYKSGTPGQMRDCGGVDSITYFFFPTNQCNLRCDYCYATKRPMVMTKEMADKAMAWILFDEEERNPGRGVSIQFFGGEPTMEWDLLVYIVESMTRGFKEHLKGRKPRFGMTTNGTLLTEDRLKWMKDVGMVPLLSLDGRKETHDKHRVYANGKGSWDDIDFDMFLKYFPNPEIRPTILPDTVEDWMKDVEWFHSKGCYTVATEVAYEADWNEEAMAKAYKTYKAMADKYIELKKKGQKVWMKFIQDGYNFMGVEKQTGTVCGIARNTVAIDAHGNLYACQRYASFANPQLKLGDVENGWDWEKLKEANKLRREHMFPDPKSGYDCETCVARWRCRGGCNAMNYQCNGDRRVILINHCKFHRMWAELSLYALASTGELWTALRKGNQCRR
jgi:uncharacterized protein